MYYIFILFICYKYNIYIRRGTCQSSRQQCLRPPQRNICLAQWRPCHRFAFCSESLMRYRNSKSYQSASANTAQPQLQLQLQLQVNGLIKQCKLCGGLVVQSLRRRTRDQLLAVHCRVSTWKLWMGDRLWAGKAPICNQLPRSTQPSIPPGQVNRVPAFMAGVKAGCVHLCRVVGNTV